MCQNDTEATLNSGETSSAARAYSAPAACKKIMRFRRGKLTVSDVP